MGLIHFQDKKIPFETSPKLHQTQKSFPWNQSRQEYCTGHNARLRGWFLLLRTVRITTKITQLFRKIQRVEVIGFGRGRSVRRRKIYFFVQNVVGIRQRGVQNKFGVVVIDARIITFVCRVRQVILYGWFPHSPGFIETFRDSTNDLLLLNNFFLKLIDDRSCFGMIGQNELTVFFTLMIVLIDRVTCIFQF